MSNRTVNILGLLITNTSFNSLLRYVKIYGKKADKINIITPNVDFVVSASKDIKLKKLYNSMDFRVADGQPLIWASIFLGEKIKEKISGSSFFIKVISELNGNQKIFLLGGSSPRILEKSIKNLRSNNAKVLIDGYSPSFGFESNTSEINGIISKINDFKPNLLFIGLGSPKQELLLESISEKINYNIAMCVGASIDFASGEKKMPPEFIKNLGFGWLWRLTSEPRRLWKRYLIKDMKFFWYIFQQKFGMKDFS